MSQKSLFYIVTGIVLIFLFQSLEKVAVKFIDSTIEQPTQQMPLFMMPGGGFQQQGLKLDGLWARK